MSCQTVSPYALTPVKPAPMTVFTPSKHVSNQLQAMSLSESPYSLIPSSPPTKKRKLNNTQTVLYQHFQRDINKQNYKIALSYLLRWILSLPIKDITFIEQYFEYFVQFICESFMRKFRADNIEKRIEEFKNNLEKNIYQKITNNHGFIGIYFHITSKDVSFWILINDEKYFINTISSDTVLNETDEKEESINVGKFSFLSLLTKLNEIHFNIIGIKLNSELIKNDLLYQKIKLFSKQNNVIIVANIKTKFECLINEIFDIKEIEIEINKLNSLINFIKQNIELKLKLEQKYKSIMPDDIILQINFISKVKAVLKSESSKDNIDIQNNLREIIFIDTSFWDLMNMLNLLFDEMIKFRHKFINDKQITLSIIFNEFKKLLKYYKETQFHLYNQQRFSNLKKSIVKGLKFVFKKLESNQSIFDGDSSLFYLSHFMDPQFTVQAQIYQIRASTELLKAMIPLNKQEQFLKLYLELRCKRGEFATNIFESFDHMRGTEFTDFAEFCINITKASATPLDVILGEYKTTPQVIDLFCFFNSKCDKLFTEKMTLLN